MLKQKAEVFKMSIYEYDEEKELKMIREDEREIGREEERKNTEAVLKKADENIIKTAVSLCKDFGSSKEDAVKKLMEKCNLSRKVAEEKIKLYWE